MHNPGDRKVCVIDTTKDDIVLFDHDNTVVSVDTPPSENDFQMGQAQDVYCKTVKLQINC